MRYIGARYVPLILGEWDNTKSYEPLSVVVYQGNSYTSKKNVPVGVEISNIEYWVRTGNYNQQIEQMYTEWNNYKDEIDDLIKDIATDIIAESYVTPKMFGAKGDGTTDDTTAFNDALTYAKNNNAYVFVPAGTYFVTSRLYCYDGTTVIGESVENTIIYLKREDETATFLFDAQGTKNVLFKNLYLKGYKVNDELGGTNGNPSLYGIIFSGNHAQIEGCIFEGFTGSAVSVRDATDILIFGNTFIDNNTNAIACTRNLNSVRIANNYFHNNHYQNINFEDTTPEYIVNDVVVSGNIINCDADISKRANWGINFSAPSMDSSVAKYNNIVVANNAIKYVYDGLHMTFTKDAIISNNVITDCTGYGIEMDNSSTFVGENIQVINNIMDSCKVASLIKYISNLDYSHNTIINTVKFGARFVCIKDSKITNNFVDNIVFASTGSQVSYGLEIQFDTGFQHVTVSENMIKSGLYGVDAYGLTPEIAIYLAIKNNYFVAETKDTGSKVDYCVCHENTLAYTLIDGNVVVGSVYAVFRDRGSSTNVFQRNNQGFAD